MSDDEIWALKRGGHDYRKLFAAYAAARSHTGQPTVILAKTIKGYGLGSGFAGRNATHQKKKVGLEELKTLRDTLHIPITDEQLEANPYLPPYYHPGMDDPAIEYMLDRRRQLGGFVPERRNKHVAVSLPGDKAYEVLAKGSGKQEVASTMAFVRLLKELMKDKEFDTALFRSSRMKHAHLVWMRSSPPRRSSTPWAKTTWLWTATSCCPTRNQSPARSCTPASTKPVPLPHSKRLVRHTQRTVNHWFRSTSSTRCSDSNALATSSGLPETNSPVGLSSVRPPAAPPHR